MYDIKCIIHQAGLLIVNLKMKIIHGVCRAIASEDRVTRCFKIVPHDRRSRYQQSQILQRDALAEYFF